MGKRGGLVEGCFWWRAVSLGNVGDWWGASLVVEIRIVAVEQPRNGTVELTTVVVDKCKRKPDRTISNSNHEQP